MIERYSLPKMSAIWQEEFKFKTMLAIEILALEALSKQKKVPFLAVKRIKSKAYKKERKRDQKETYKRKRDLRDQEISKCRI